MVIFVDDVKEASDVALGETADVEAVLGVYIEDGKVSSEGWGDSLWLLAVDLVNTDSSYVVST